MPKVVTFTANLLAETTYEFASWERGKTQRATGERFQVGGKGINVSKMLNRLEAANEALCFAGGAFGPKCQAWMSEAGISFKAFNTDCETRSGSIIWSGSADETTFLGIDSFISSTSIQEAVDYLYTQQEPFVFAICGSIQAWKEAKWDPLRKWIVSRPDNARLVVDTYGPSLQWFAQQEPELIKINRQELLTFFENDVSNSKTENLIAKASERFGARDWIITDGSEPIWLKPQNTAASYIIPPTVECTSPTGCGDVFFATLIDCLYNKSGYSLEAAARLAADYASRSAAQAGIAEFEI